MTNIDSALIQIVISIVSATIAAVYASNKVVRDNEHRFTRLEGIAETNKANIAEQWIKLDKIMDAVNQIQMNCIALHPERRENKQ